jgi:hypothetical protein
VIHAAGPEDDLERHRAPPRGTRRSLAAFRRVLQARSGSARNGTYRVGSWQSLRPPSRGAAAAISAVADRVLLP